jgi:hypothetical protein
MPSTHDSHPPMRQDAPPDAPAATVLRVEGIT